MDLFNDRIRSFANMAMNFAKYTNSYDRYLLIKFRDMNFFDENL